MTNSRRGGANAGFLPLRQVWLFFSDKPAVLFRVFGVLFDFLHPDFIRVVHAELEQGGVGVKFEVGLEFRRVEHAAFVFQFFYRQRVERDGVAAEPKLVLKGSVLVIILFFAGMNG